MEGTGRETFNHSGLFVKSQPNISSPPPYFLYNDEKE